MAGRLALGAGMSFPFSTEHVMSRPNQTVKLMGVLRRRSNSGSETVGTIDDGDYFRETSSGTNRRRKPVGDFIPPTAYSMEMTRYRRAYGSIDFINDSYAPGSFKLFGCVGAAGTGLPSGGFNSLNRFNDAFVAGSVPTALRDKALIKARLAMKDQDVNLGQAYAEREMTMRLVGDTAVSLAKAYRSLRKGDWKKAAKQLGLNDPKKPRGSSAPQKWLEYQYGWQPMLSDVYGSVQALSKLDRGDWRVTGYGRASEPISAVFESPSSVVAGRERMFVSGEYGVFVRIDAIPESDLLRAFSSLGLTNPAVVAWELVPFSFVADWMLPIGDYLSSMDAMLGYGSPWCSISSLTRVEWRGEGIPGKQGATRAKNDFTSYKKYVRLNRTVSTSVPLPTLPRFKNPVSLGHMANGLSLLAQTFGSKRTGHWGRYG